MPEGAKTFKKRTITNNNTPDTAYKQCQAVFLMIFLPISKSGYLGLTSKADAITKNMVLDHNS